MSQMQKMHNYDSLWKVSPVYTQMLYKTTSSNKLELGILEQFQLQQKITFLFVNDIHSKHVTKLRLIQDLLAGFC